MSSLQIITNNHWRQFRYRYEVPPEILASEFDYQDENDALDGFFKYRGCWYHLDQFIKILTSAPFSGEWDGCASDSFFSGIFIRVSDDCEEYKVGRYYS